MELKQLILVLLEENNIFISYLNLLHDWFVSAGFYKCGNAVCFGKDYIFELGQRRVKSEDDRFNAYVKVAEIIEIQNKIGDNYNACSVFFSFLLKWFAFFCGW